MESTARVLLLAGFCTPCTGLPQPGLGPLSGDEREDRIIEEIRQEQEQEGPYSKRLINPMTALALLYQERGAYSLAAAMIEEALRVVRANSGLQSLEQAPLIRLLIENQEELGDHAGAWDSEQELLALAERHRDDLRTARILRETADRRMEVLQRYDAGEFPPEIVLGCYYNEPELHEPTEAPNCNSGSRRRVRQSLLSEAQSYYGESINIILRNESYSSDELPRLLMELVESSYRYGNPALGRRSLRYLLAYQTTNSDPWLERIETLVRMADWDLLYSSQFGTRLEDSALATYVQAYDLAKEQGIEEESIAQIFAPETPVVLPSLIPNPLVSPETPESTGHVDVAFIVTRDGKSKHIEVLDREGSASRGEQKELVQLIKRSRFRPMTANGEFADSARIVVRYYSND